MSSRDVVRLILAHLAATGVAACDNRVERIEPAVPATVSATPTGPSAPTASTASAAPATSAAPAAPSATSSAAHAPPSSCRVGTSDCGRGFVCAARTDGAHLLPGPGNCWPAGQGIPGGRPLVVEGEARVAEARATQPRRV